MHQHILKHVEEINEALNKEGQSVLCLSTADEDIISKIVEVMNYFFRSDQYTPAEIKTTINQMIPVVDSLENALENINKNTASINPVSLQPEPVKKSRLLDFSSVSLDVCSTYSSGLDKELVLL